MTLKLYLPTVIPYIKDRNGTAANPSATWLTNFRLSGKKLSDLCPIKWVTVPVKILKTSSMSITKVKTIFGSNTKSNNPKVINVILVCPTLRSNFMNSYAMNTIATTDTIAYPISTHLDLVTVLKA